MTTKILGRDWQEIVDRQQGVYKPKTLTGPSQGPGPEVLAMAKKALREKSLETMKAEGLWGLIDALKWCGVVDEN